MNERQATSTEIWVVVFSVILGFCINYYFTGHMTVKALEWMSWLYLLSTSAYLGFIAWLGMYR